LLSKIFVCHFYHSIFLYFYFISGPLCMPRHLPHYPHFHYIITVLDLPHLFVYITEILLGLYTRVILKVMSNNFL
jgi:hypothetical protein